MAEQLSLLLRPRTVPQTLGRGPVVLEELSATQRAYLFGYEFTSQDTAIQPPGSLLTWRIPSGARLVDPALLAAFRAEYEAGRARLLVIDPEHTLMTYELFFEVVSGLMIRKQEVDFAWRFERHWLVEWSDLPRHQRPPVLLDSGDSVIILGAMLPPKLLPTLAALSAFPYVTADELRATATFLQADTPTPSELSRVLSYAERFGLIIAATGDAAERYWAARGRNDRRPLRLYASVLAPLIVEKLDSDTWPNGWSSPYLLASGPLPDAQATDLLQEWRNTRDALRARGLRTI